MSDQRGFVTGTCSKTANLYPSFGVLMLVCAVLSATPGAAQKTNLPAEVHTNQTPPKLDGHSAKQPMQEQDSTSGPAKAGQTNQPATDDKTEPGKKSPPTVSFNQLRYQADALKFPAEQLGPAHAGIRTYARYAYILTNLEQQVRAGKPLELEEQASLAFDVFLRDAKTGEFKAASQPNDARSLLEISEQQPSGNRAATNVSGAKRLPDATIAAIGYLALRFTLYESTSYLDGYKANVLNYRTNAAAYWHPWRRLLETGLTPASLERALIEIPLAPRDPVEPYIAPPSRLWTSPENLARHVEKVRADPTCVEATRIILIYCYEVDDSAG